MRITVKTGAANKKAPDITDELLTTTEAALERGRTELYNEMNAYLTTLQLPFKQLMPTGSLCEVHNLANNEVYRGKITSISIAISENGIDQRIEVEHPA